MKQVKQLKDFFSSKSIAVIGASNNVGKVGNDVMINLKNNFNGDLYPVNLKESEILGFKAYSSIKNLPKTPELAIIIVPASVVIDSLESLAIKGCKNFVIISAGFKEVGGIGIDLENKLDKLKNKYNLRILGPNCLGYIATNQNINASFSRNFPNIGNIGFFSQSGALGTAVLDMSEAQKLGLSYFISLGNKLDINELDLLDYFLEDKKTTVVLAYLESIVNGQVFINKAKAVVEKKPVIILKAGKTEKGSEAVSSHTGSMAGTAIAYSSAFRQSGVIEAEDLEDFFALAKGFSYSELPKGNRVAIVTNAGGPGIMITDLLPINGLELAKLSEKTKAILKKNLPEAASNYNPIDILGDAKSDRYKIALKSIINDNSVDSIIVVLTPQKMSDIKETIEVIGQIKQQTKKTIICCFLGEAEITKHYQFFADYKLAQFNYPSQAVNVLGQMVKYHFFVVNKKRVFNKSSKLKISKKATTIISKKDSLTESDCREILNVYNFPLHRAKVVINAEEGVKLAQKIGYPLAIKVISKEVIHKSDVGGVKIGINNDEDLIKAIREIKNNVKTKVLGAKIEGYLVGEMISGFQAIVGMKRDPQFGPLIMVGLGGIYAEIFKDVVFRIAPFDLREANKMIEELKIYPMINGARGQKLLDQKALANLLVKLSDFSLLYPKIKEIDFNPVMVLERGRGVKIVDVRMMK